MKYTTVAALKDAYKAHKGDLIQIKGMRKLFQKGNDPIWTKLLEAHSTLCANPEADLLGKQSGQDPVKAKQFRDAHKAKKESLKHKLSEEHAEPLPSWVKDGGGGEEAAAGRGSRESRESREIRESRESAASE